MNNNFQPMTMQNQSFYQQGMGNPSNSMSMGIPPPAVSIIPHTIHFKRHSIRYYLNHMKYLMGISQKRCL